MIKIINIVPQSQSGETNQDSEPNIAVNPANPLQVVVSAFTPDPLGGANAPVYLSTDGGSSWTLNSIVPSAGTSGTADITLKFAGGSSRLFAAILDGTSGNFEVHRTTNVTSPAPMTQLESRANEDQPYVQAATEIGGSGAGTDRVYIGVNDFNAAGGKTATVEQTLDGAPAAPVFSSVRVETRTTLGQDGPQVRPAIHPDGTVYAAFYRWLSSSGSWPGNTLVITNAELIVVRDDNWATGASPFTALTDASDGLAGRRVATGLSFPFNKMGVTANGQERWGGDISIAADPRNSSTVYVAYSTQVSGVYTLQLVRSLDRGVTWSAVLLSISNAKNPGVAINSLGKIAIVYQQITGSGATQKWEVHFRDSTDGTTWSDTTLCTTLSQSPLRTFSPYVGDYLHMMAAGKDFYGVFAASNVPDLANFPQGVTYLRNHDFTTKKLFGLDGVTLVSPSIDPFFFKVTQIASNHSDFYIRDWTNTSTDHDPGVEPSINPWFYVTSDVWNQRTNVAPTFVTDQAQNEDPQNDATNYAFARISRNDTGSAETVNVDFLVAEFGTGSPYSLVASTTVSFAAGDTSKIAKAAWTLPATSSTHLCLAVQISTPSDPFAPPGLSGNTPGWPTTDLMVINDNNKAQRNMSVHYGLAGFGSTHYAIIRNAAKVQRDLVLRIKVDPKVAQAFASPAVQAEGMDPVALAARPATITLAGMKPGESRWIAFGMKSFRAATGAALPVDLVEVVEGKQVNGFRFNITAADNTKAMRELLILTTAVFQRLKALFKAAAADDVLRATKTLIATRPTSASYLKYVQKIREGVSASVKPVIDTAGADRKLGIASALDTFSRADVRSFGAVFAAHVTLLNRLDVAATLSRQPERTLTARAPRAGRQSA